MTASAYQGKREHTAQPAPSDTRVPSDGGTLPASPSDTTRIDDAIAACEAAGLAVVRPRDNDQSLRDLWRQIGSLLRMAEDLAAGGAKLRINHPSYFAPTADMIGLTRSAMLGKIDAVLAAAIVVREDGE